MLPRTSARARTADTRSRTSILWALLTMVLWTAAVVAARAHAEIPGADAKRITAPWALLTHEARTAFAEQAEPRLAELSDEEYFSYSGVGALICTVDGHKQMSTAFLVGSFDLAVTVAHTFVAGGSQASPSDCVYTTTDSTGQIRERLPVAYYKSQWIDANADGVPAKDLAVVRLAQKSAFAHRTLPLGKFSGAAAPVVMIGFASDVDTDTFKRKSRGMVYGRDAGRKNTPAVADIYAHDLNTVDLASGAPVLDEQTGVIIGVHTTLLPSTLQATAEHTAVAPVPTARNALITMNQWLESNLRAEIAQTKEEQK